MLSIAYIALSWPSRSLWINCMCSLFLSLRLSHIYYRPTKRAHTHKKCLSRSLIPVVWYKKTCHCIDISVQVLKFKGRHFFSVQIAYETEWDVTFAHEKRLHLKLFALKPLIMAMQINLDGSETANNVKRHINGTTTTAKPGPPLVNWNELWMIADVRLSVQKHTKKHNDRIHCRKSRYKVIIYRFRSTVMFDALLFCKRLMPPYSGFGLMLSISFTCVHGIHGMGRILNLVDDCHLFSHICVLCPSHQKSLWFFSPFSR